MHDKNDFTRMKDKIENYLYNWQYYENELEKINLEIEAVRAERNLQYEKYPQLNCDRISNRNRYKKSDQIIETVINIVDEYDRKLKRMESNKMQEFGGFIKFKSTLNSLKGDERHLIRLKYIERKRGKDLYKRLNYSKSGYYKKQDRIINKLIYNFGI